MVKILHCGKNTIAESVPVYGFGLGPNKAKAKSVAMNMAHGFAIAVGTQACSRGKMPDGGMS